MRSMGVSQPRFLICMCGGERSIYVLDTAVLDVLDLEYNLIVIVRLFLHNYPRQHKTGQDLRNYKT